MKSSTVEQGILNNKGICTISPSPFEILCSVLHIIYQSEEGACLTDALFFILTVEG
jgi:hypothetical protein